MHILELLYHLNSDLFRYKVQEFCPKLGMEEGCLDLFDPVPTQPTEDDLGLEREYTRNSITIFAKLVNQHFWHIF